MMEFPLVVGASRTGEADNCMEEDGENGLDWMPNEAGVVGVKADAAPMKAAAVIILSD